MGLFTTPTPFTPESALIIVKQTLKAKAQTSGDERLLKLLSPESEQREQIERSDSDHRATLEHVVGALTDHNIPAKCVNRQPGENFEVDAPLIITIGGDGTFLDASHSVTTKVPVLGVNSAPVSSFGHFCLTDKAGFDAALADILSGKRKAHPLLRLKLTLDGEVLTPLVLNEVLIAHGNPAGTSRYVLQVGEKSVEQKSSGLLISTPSGSTGFNRSAGGVILPITDTRFTFFEREPFIRPNQSAELRSGIVDRTAKLTITSEMLGGKIFLDGAHICHDFLRGSVLTVEASEEDLMAYVNPDCHSGYGGNQA